MTRDEFKLTESQCVTADWCEGYNNAIDLMQEYFESRTCENCTQNQICDIQDEWSIMVEDKQSDGVLWDEGTKPFGCNKFERRE